jgi:hypothetical protein
MADNKNVADLNCRVKNILLDDEIKKKGITGTYGTHSNFVLITRSKETTSKTSA